MNLYPATAFLRHLLTSRSPAGYGVHSPFVYDFLTNVVRGTNDPYVIGAVERLRQEMLADRRTVRVTDLGAGPAGRTAKVSDMGVGSAGMTANVTDLGAGPAKRKGEERNISRVAATSALPARQVALLSRIARNLSLSDARPMKEMASDKGIILELGTSLGISTLALALAAPGRRVVTVEGCPALAEIAAENLLRHGASNAEVINMEFTAALEMLRSSKTTVSLAFIDGNHRGPALRNYIETIRSMGEEMIIVADDIHMNREMYTAWRSLAAPEKTIYGSGKIASPTGVNKPSSIVIIPEPPSPSAPPSPPAPQSLPSPSAPTSTGPLPPFVAPATLETFRFGILFCLRNLTPGHYHIRY